VTLLAYSPLAAGLLTGKYQGGAIPEGSRMSIGPEMGGRNQPRIYGAVDAYLEVATRHGLDLIHMALAFTVQRPFSVSTIFGASTAAQLEHILAGRDTVLSAEVLADLDAVHRAHPMPY
jgi:aryl-alcohol dehydrogenase-like predicted oxidoreductase